MIKMQKKLWSLLLAVCLVATMMPTMAFAVEKTVSTASELTTAIESATSGDTIKLSGSITDANTTLTIPADKTLTLDLARYTLEINQIKVDGSLTICASESEGKFVSTNSTDNGSAIEVAGTGKVILESGTIESADGKQLYGIYANEGGTAIVKDGTISTYYAPLGGNNTTGDMNFKIEGGTLTAEYGPAIYMPGQVSLTITGGTLIGGISLRMGQVNISGGTINAITKNIDSPAQFYDYSGNAWLPDALYVFNGTYTSENATYGNSLNLNITGGTFNCTNDQGSAVAIYDLGKVQQKSKVSISGTAKLSCEATNRDAYQVLSLGDIGVSSTAAGYGEYTGKVVSAISGGEFSSDVSKYVATGYKCTESDGKYTVGTYNAGELEVKPDASADSDTTSATLNGVYSSDNNTITNPSAGGDTGSTGNQPSGKVENNTVTVTLPEVTNATTASLNVAADTVSSLAGNGGSLTINSDVGNLEVNNAALESISENNTDNSAVTLSITVSDNTTSGGSLVYTLTAEDANGNPVFAKGDANGSIDVTVDYTGSNPTVYYMGDNGLEKVTSTYNSEDGKLTWTVSHFSDYLIQDGDHAISYKTTNGQVQFTDDFSTALSAVASSGGTITVHRDVTDTLTAVIKISGDVTINGSGKISVTAPTGSTTHCFDILKDGSLTLEKVTLDITGTKDNVYNHGGYGIDINHGGKLILNGATVNFNGLEAATCCSKPSTTDTSVTTSTIELKNGSHITANTIDGNFSNGGIWTVESGSSITIDGCGSHGLSADAVTVGADSSISVSNTGYRGISINASYLPADTSGALTIQAGGTVNVTNCGAEDATDSPRPAVYLANSTDKDAALIVAEGATLNVTATEDGKNTRILLNSDDGVQNTLAGTIIGKIMNGTGEGSTVVAAIDGGSAYTTLNDAVYAATTSGQTVRLLTTEKQELGQPISSGVTLLIADGQTVNITALTTVVGSAGTIQVNAGGALSVGGEAMIGTGGNVQITDGSVKISKTGTALGSDLALKFEFEGAKAEVPAGGYWTTVKTVGQYSVPMNVTLDASSELTVKGQLRIANGSTLTNNGKITVNNGGLLRVGSEGNIDGSGTITNSGIVTLHKEGDNQATVPSITLTSGGEVYSEFDAASKIGPSGNVSTAAGSFTVNGVESGTPSEPVTFGYKYTYYTPSTSTGSGGGGGSASTYAVSTSSTTNGTIAVSPKSAAKDATVTVTVKPNDGYVLDTLTVKDADGKAISVTKKSATEYTFKMPASKVTISATFAEETVEPTSPFSDVATSAYYYDAVLWAVENDITNGTTATTFSPNADVSRAQMVTFLWRAAGSPKATGVNPFTDVKSSDYYYDAVLWAVANGVTNGTTETTFSPAKAVSRAQSVTFQWRAAGSPAASANSFADVSADAYYADAVAWAVANEITNGMSATSFGPDVTVTRAQAVTFLYRAAN